MKAETEGKGLK